MTEEKSVEIDTKEELKEILERENIESKEYKRYIVLFEAKKLNKIYGIYKLDYYEGKDINYRASLILPIENISIFNELDIGKSKFYGFTFDSKGEGIRKIMEDFFKRSFKEGKIQDFIPFARGSD